MPGGIRTPDLMVRSHALYPTELQAHNSAVSAMKTDIAFSGGEKGIRTLDTVARIHDFQSCAFDQLGHLSTTMSAFLLYLYFLSLASLLCKNFSFSPGIGDSRA